MQKEAKARIKINNLLQQSGWRFFDNEKDKANIVLELNTKLTKKDVDAFGNDTLAFNTALQALFNYTDHESLDMCGMRIQLDAPVDVQAAVGNKDTFANRRVLRNGQLEVNAGSAWNTEVFSSTASYSSGDDLMLTNVANIASIPVGSLVTGTGAGLAGGCFDELEC